MLYEGFPDTPETGGINLVISGIIAALVEFMILLSSFISHSPMDRSGKGEHEHCNQERTCEPLNRTEKLWEKPRVYWI